MTRKPIRISFCTVWLHDDQLWKKSLPANVQHLLGHEQVEYLLLDASGDDEMEQWVRQQRATLHYPPALRYKRIPADETISYAQAKNRAAVLAKGEIICFISPWQVAVAGLNAYLLGAGVSDEAICLHADLALLHTATHVHPPVTVYGLLCTGRKRLLAMGGYDERMQGMGNEDQDLLNRLARAGVQPLPIPATLQGRQQLPLAGKGLSFSPAGSEVAQLYIRYCSPAQSELLYLHANGLYDSATLVQPERQQSDSYERLFVRAADSCLLAWQPQPGGRWKEAVNEQLLCFHPAQGSGFVLSPVFNSRYDVMKIADSDVYYYAVEDPWLLDRVLWLRNVFGNYTVLEENNRLHRVAVNTAVRKRPRKAAASALQVPSSK
ncbi:galactosyltransferase-related protein [Paraflavitalea pollutisoli]|uniref:galactosyltransferase-related protein n=1 Tax=Paraflavitalea pollutisoli TaxID=3034143 RepID=UPI0023EAF029|nr:galactosyltransferase-related protein [Paraflavitalea sp. H1-2-19X]